MVHFMKPAPLPALQELCKVIEYEGDTGVFRNISRRSASAPAGAITGCRAKSGYVSIRYKKRLYLAHRLAWLFAHMQDPADLDVDHINGDPSDNRICNLRLATRRQNLLNGKRPVTNTTGFKGVFKNQRGKYVGRIRGLKGIEETASYLTAEEAAEAYSELASRIAGEFARTQ